MAMATKTTVSKRYDANNVLIEHREEVEHISFKNNVQEEGEYVKLYIKKIDDLCSLSSGALKLYLQMLKRVSYANIENTEEYGGQIVTIRADLRKSLCETLRIKERAFYDSIRQLRDENLIKQVAKNTYQISPFHAGRGLYKYSTKYEYGGIEDLRTIYPRSEQMEAEIENDKLVIEALQKELDDCYEKYMKCTDKYESQGYASAIRNYQKELEKLHDENYRKTIRFPEAVEKLRKEIQDTNEMMDEDFTDDYM